MERRKFLKTCCVSAIGVPLLTTLHACGSVIYYVPVIKKANRLVVKKAAFLQKENNKQREFVLVKTTAMNFPICLYKINDNTYIASLLECTHRGCELNVGGGIYTCPCHGSEFSVEGTVLEGPAATNLKTFETVLDNENIYILHS